MVTEAIAAQPRNPLPAVILDKKPPLDAESGLGFRRRGRAVDPQCLRHHGRRPGAHEQWHRHVIANLSNPTTRSTCSARRASSRIEKPVSLPDDDDIADPDNSAFGPTGVMREIVRTHLGTRRFGAHGIPANVAFTISLLDSNGRRVTIDPHRSLALGASGRTSRMQRVPRAHHGQWRHGALARSRGFVQFRLCRCHSHRRRLPRHREHHLSRGGRHHGAGPVARRFVVHRYRHQH